MDRPILLALLLSIALCSCAGSAGGQRSALLSPAGFSPPAALTDSLPPLPKDQLVHMGKATAAIDAQLDGNLFENASAGVSVNGSNAQFISAEGTLEFAVYRFSGTEGESVGSLSAELNGIDGDEQLYFAISDYTTERWFFVAAQDTASLTSALDNQPGRFVSPLGNTYVAAIAFGDNSLELESISLRYLDRFSISGQVQDELGNPLPGVFVASVFGGLTDTTDGNGNFLLIGLPEGSWPVAATADGWTFYDQPALVTVDGSDGECVIIGHRGGANFTVKETLPGNNNLPGADFDLEAGPLEDCIAAVDDSVDFYSFEVSSPGHYYLYLEDLDGEIGVNYMVLETIDPLNPFVDVLFGPEVLNGNYAMGFHVYGSEPLRFSLEFRCFQGGGNYRISLIEGETHALGVRLEQDGEKLHAAKLSVDHTSLGETIYFTRANGNETFLDYSRVPGLTTITPVADSYTFDPPARVTLMGVEVLDMEFVAEPGSFDDNLEPNNDQATAQSLGSLPYESVHQFSCGDTDPDDWYSFTPAAGKGLDIRLFGEESPIDLTIGMSLYRANGEFITFAESGDESFHLERSVITDGGEYFLRVQRGDNRRLSYTFHVREFDPVALQLGVSVEGEPVEAAPMFEVYSGDFKDKYLIFPIDQALSEPRYYAEGEVLNVECMRFGLSVHRQTKRIVIGSAEEQIVLFDAPDWGSDDHEPNDPPGDPALLQLPFTINATCNSQRDTDYYLLTSPGNQTLSLSFSSQSSDSRVNVVLSHPGRGEILDELLLSGDKVFFEATDNEPIEMVVTARNREVDYTISVEGDEAYRINGQFFKQGSGQVNGGTVYVRETGKTYKTSGFGNYSTDPLPPGDYTLVFLAVGFDPGYEERTVTISTEDLEEDFNELVESNGDDYEPNNSLATAHEIELGDGYAAVCGALHGLPDGTDWYKLDNVPAGTAVQFLLNAEDVSSMNAEIFFGSEDFSVGELYKAADGTWIRDEVLGTAGDYFIRIRGTGSYALVTSEFP